MMDTMSPGVAAAVLAALLVVVGGGYVVMRVVGARAVEGDHAGEKGYVQEDRTAGRRD